MSDVSFDPAQFPPRFTLAGVLLNLFQRPSGTSKDGRDYGGDWVLQLMSADHLKNGESKLVPTDVSLGEDPRDAEKFRGRLGQRISLPVSVYPFNGNLGIRLASDAAGGA
jgi:hypothetical protein